MTPERAETLARHWLSESRLTIKYYERSLTRYILEICAEERHAALTEAISQCTFALNLPDMRERLTAIRDKEQP